MALTKVRNWWASKGSSHYSPRTREEFLLAEHHFHAALRRERMRSDRNQVAFTLLTLELPKSRGRSETVRLITSVLAGRIRETDLAGWLKRRTIGIILPETPTKGAWKLADDICQLLTGGLRLPNCEVYEYPPDSDDEDGGNGGGPPSRKARSLHELIDDPLPTWKRAVDMVGAGTALAIAAPIMLLVMLLIKIQSPGPALYRQERIGRHRRRFKVWKFRTMVCDADRILQECLAKSPELREEWNREHKLKNDPRITPIGHWLRKTSVDELPQLWNVLCGQMSLVGPRPIVAAEIVKYADKFGPYCKVLPGITGLWQVSGRNDTSYAERVDLDCHYARHSSLRLDVAILFKTVHVVLLRRGAY